MPISDNLWERLRGAIRPSDNTQADGMPYLRTGGGGSTWILASASNGVAIARLIASLPGAGLRVRIHALAAVADATLDVKLQSPSGTDITGTMRFLPGGGIAQVAAVGNWLFQGGANAEIVVNTSGPAALGGYLAGVIE